MRHLWYDRAGNPIGEGQRGAVIPHLSLNHVVELPWHSDCLIKIVSGGQR